MRQIVSEVPVGQFQVANLSYSEIVELLAASLPIQEGCYIAYALHVGGLNSRNDPSYISAMSEADLVYADGAGVVIIARLAGGQRTERVPTTDLGHDLLDAAVRYLGRSPRVFLLGGPNGLACRAANSLAEKHDMVVAGTCDGFGSLAVATERIRRARPDILFVGLGAPGEMKWVHSVRRQLPPTLVVTCGGWFGFLAGSERRAPRTLQRIGCEWLWRLAQNPRRLWRRYFRGSLSVAALMAHTLRSRRGR